MSKDTLRTLPVQLGEVINLKIEKMAYDNSAIGHYKDFVIMVDRGAPGDTAEVEITSLRPNYARGKIVELVKSDNSYRTEAECKLFKVCGGCQWQHLPYEKQLEQKNLILKDFFNKLNLEEGILKNIIGLDDPWHYRNKVQYPVRTVKETGRLKAGYFEWHSRDLINVKYCPIQNEIFDSIIETVRDLAEKYEITAYEAPKPGSKTTHSTGWLRHICVRAGRNNKGDLEVLLTLIAVTDTMRDSAGFVKDVMKHHPEIVGICLNKNTNTTNVIYGEKTKVLAGRGFLFETLNDLTFKISATSFFQVNTPQAEKMLDIIDNYADLKGNETVLDAYCGGGVIAISSAKKAKKVLGIEEVRQSIEDANYSAKLNKIENFTFITGKVENKIQDVLEEFHPDVIILDPPRIGCNKKVIESILKSDIKKIIYTSCNPTTLVRDLELLSAYKIKSIQPIDMFPHTYHIECVVLLEKISED